MTIETWKIIAEQKQAARDALIPEAWRLAPGSIDKTTLNVIDVPRTCGILSNEEVAITETPANLLVERMATGSLKAYDVTLAFCKRSAIAQQLTNCLTEIMYDAALACARELDDKLASGTGPVGPLHGLPVSLKDNFNVQGVDTTVGFVGWANHPAAEEDESVMTKILRDAGAVLYCKTNVPTAMMMPETYNNVWGYTTNPFNRSASSGGSSGGESALLALKGSPVGVGTDIGGSIRIPASFCGLYSLKPSFGRFATYGARSGMPGQEAVRSINGPMSSTLEGVELWTRAVLASEPWWKDPNMLPLPYREASLPSKLCFGLITDNGTVKPTPPVQRALKETRAALEKAGHSVVEWAPYDAPAAARIIQQLFVGDGGGKIASAIAAGNEPWPEGMTAYADSYEKTLREGNKPSVEDYWSIQAERTVYAKRALEAWKATANMTDTGRPFDGVISPVTPWPASPQYCFGGDVSYTAVWNILDQPSATFPVTNVDQTLDAKAAIRPRNDKEKAIWDDYEVEKLLGLPVALQIIGPRLCEEQVLAMTKIISDCLASFDEKI